MTADTYDIDLKAYDQLGTFDAEDGWRFAWAHGWGQNRSAFRGLAQSLVGLGGHILLDFPGFGSAPRPMSAWSTADYADYAARLLGIMPPAKRTIWIGHSFGGRVGIQLAARHPQIIDRLILIAAAGLPPERSFAAKVRLKSKIYAFKGLKRLAPVIGLDEERLRQRFGSTDYRNAGNMREILVKVIGEDLSDQSRQIRCPTRLIYGGKDIETPPDIGRRLAGLIPDAELTVLDDQDHYSLLAGGRHLVAKRIRDFLGA